MTSTTELLQRFLGRRKKNQPAKKNWKEVHRLFAVILYNWQGVSRGAVLLAFTQIEVTVVFNLHKRIQEKKLFFLLYLQTCQPWEIFL